MSKSLGEGWTPASAHSPLQHNEPSTDRLPVDGKGDGAWNKMPVGERINPSDEAGESKFERDWTTGDKRSPTETGEARRTK
jgi:hypothetical protein